MLSVISLLIVATLSLLLARIATVALTATGMPRESARFQARSALTGVGFTTGEAENVVNHPVRRRIIMWLMLAHSIGVAAYAATLIGSFATAEGPARVLLRGGLLLGGLVLLLVASRNSWVDRRLSRVIGKAVCRFTDLEVRDYVWMLRLSGDYAISEMQVQPDDWLANKSLIEADLPHEGVLVLGIVRGDGSYVGAPTGPTVLLPYDTLVLYGRAPILAELDERHAGPEGDRAHEQAVARHRRIVREERIMDRDRPQAAVGGA